MANLFEMFGTDKALEVEGIWYEFDKTTKFRLARAGGANMRFAKALEAKTRPYRRQIENGTIDNDLANSLLRDAFCETVILDWQGVSDAEGNEIAFSADAAKKLFEQLPDLFTELQGEATRLSNFRNELLEDDAGN